MANMAASIPSATTMPNEMLQKVNEAEKAAHDNLNAVKALKTLMLDNPDHYSNSILTKLGQMEEMLQKESVQSKKQCKKLQKRNDSLLLQVLQLQEEKATLEAEILNCKERNKMLQEKIVQKSSVKTIEKCTQTQNIHAGKVLQNPVKKLDELKKINKLRAQTQWLNERAASWLAETSQSAGESSQGAAATFSSSSGSIMQSQNQINIGMILQSQQNIRVPSQQNSKMLVCSSENGMVKSSESRFPQLTHSSLVEELRKQHGAVHCVTPTGPLRKLNSEDPLKQDSSGATEILHEVLPIVKNRSRNFFRNHGLKPIYKYGHDDKCKTNPVTCEMSAYVPQLGKTVAVTCKGPKQKGARNSCSASLKQKLNELLSYKKTKVALTTTRTQSYKVLQGANVNDKFNNVEDNVSTNCTKTATEIAVKNSEEENPRLKNITRANAQAVFFYLCNMHKLEPKYKYTEEGNKYTEDCGESLSFICEISVHVQQLGRTLVERQRDLSRGSAKKLCAFFLLLKLFCCDFEKLNFGMMTKEEATKMLQENEMRRSLVDSPSGITMKKENGENLGIAIGGSNKIENAGKSVSNNSLKTCDKNCDKSYSDVVAVNTKMKPNFENKTPENNLKIAEKKNADSSDSDINDYITADFQSFCAKQNICPQFTYSTAVEDLCTVTICELSIFVKELGRFLHAKVQRNNKKAARTACMVTILQDFCAPNINHLNNGSTTQ